MYKALSFTVLVGMLQGCSSVMIDTVLRRAEFDLSCTGHSIQTQDLGYKTIGASGCGKKATYILNGECLDQDSCQAIMNSNLE